MLDLDNEIRKPRTHEKFEDVGKLFRGLHILNLYQNPIIMGREEYFKFKDDLAYYRDKMNKFFDEIEDFGKSISLEGKHRHLVEYALKLNDKANEFGESGCFEEASRYTRYTRDIARFINGDCKELSSYALEDYESLMGKKYVNYPRRLHIEPTLAKDMYGDNLSAMPYKGVIDNLFKLLSDLVVNDVIDTVVVHNDYALGTLVMVVVRLLKKDGYDLNVIRVEDIINKHISPKQLEVDNKLRDLVTSISTKDEGGYSTELVYVGAGKVALREV